MIALVRALAWPVLIGAVVFGLRKQIPRLIAAGFRIEGPGLVLDVNQKDDLKAEVEAEVDVSEREAPAAEGSGQADPSKGPQEVIGPEVGWVGSELTRATTLAELHPAAAVMAAWRDIEVALNEGLEGLVRHDRRLSPRAMTNLAVDFGLVTRADIDAIEFIRRFRNEVTHSAGEPTVGQALEIVDLANAVVRSIKVRASRRTTEEVPPNQ